METKFIFNKTPYGNKEVDFCKSGSGLSENGSLLKYFGNGILEIRARYGNNLCETLSELLSINPGLEIRALTGPHISNKFGDIGIIVVFSEKIINK